MRWLNVLLELNRVVPEVSITGMYTCRACSDHFLMEYMKHSGSLSRMEVIDRQMREAPDIELAVGALYPRCQRCGRRTQWELKTDN